MSYSDSSHFSDKLSYKILFILSYRLKDMNFARYTQLQQFSEEKKEKQTGSFLTEGNQPGSLTGGAGAR
jgi:hypothetical protein